MEQDTTKTRIETAHLLLISAIILSIREQDPLKQGLKLIIMIYQSSNQVIREQDPLKQGLKHSQPKHCFQLADS